MTTRDPSLIKAERLRAVMSMPEYADTIGKWLEESMASSLHEMTHAEPDKFLSHQGAYRALSEIKDQIESTFLAEESALKKEAQRRNQRQE